MRAIWRVAVGWAALGLALLGLAGCARPPTQVVAERVDYSDSRNWALLPHPDGPRGEVDVFYVYPTVVADRDNALMSWDDEAVREKTRRIARQQVGAVAGEGNVYAPFVRQLEFYRIMEALRGERSPEEAMETGAQDVREAFRHYWEHWNGGRPFILMGHSQGAMDLFFLLRDEFAEGERARQLVAAYLIGMAIRAEDVEGLGHVRLAQGADDVGGVVSYNSEGASAEPSPFTGAGTYGINPLNWRTDGEAASRTQHLGAVFFDATGGVEREIAEFCGARLDAERGALVVEPSVPGPWDAPEILGEGVFHMNDVYFFYRNLGENARRRTAAWMEREGRGR
jgi:hypothetical protein